MLDKIIIIKDSFNLPGIQSNAKKHHSHILFFGKRKTFLKILYFKIVDVLHSKENIFLIDFDISYMFHVYNVYVYIMLMYEFVKLFIMMINLKFFEYVKNII